MPKKQEKIDFAIGGQAVIEGVMMRSPNTIVISVRRQSGKIKTQERFYTNLTHKIRALNIPFVRGIINLFEMMVIGTKAINFSANEYAEDLEEEFADKSKKAKAKAKAKPKKQSNVVKRFIDALLFTLSLVMALALSVFLFKFLPLWITSLLETQSQTIADNWILFNLIDGILKTSIFILYIFILSLVPSFRRIFEYHGAEHKAVFNYEKSLPLTVKNSRKQSRFHPRCGTSFILIVFVISVIVYTFVPKQPDFWTNLGNRLLFLPLIAGIAYEYLKISARFCNQTWTKLFVAPGLWLQRLTTKEPTDDQIEGALNSLKLALEQEKAAK